MLAQKQYMSKPYVTALIDSYNHERFIEQAIRSVLQQDLAASDLEILVVDDGSTDTTPEIVQSFAPRVRLLRKINGGQASAFNAAIAEAQGEIVAFLDGDDWWAPGKLPAVLKVFAGDKAIGLVGHGLTQVYADGRLQTEQPREISRFRITSNENAKHFRMRKSFLGTSRMAYRKELLQQIGPVPAILKFQADEYLFTIAALLADVVILPEVLTFYRLHEKNLFQLANDSMDGFGRKQQVLAALAECLRKKLGECGVRVEIANTIVECVQVEADLLHLMVDSGPPWKTVAVERKIMQVFHNDASLQQRVFSWARLIPAFAMPAAAYYRWRHRLARLSFYKELRLRFLPFPVPEHVERHEKVSSQSIS